MQHHSYSQMPNMVPAEHVMAVHRQLLCSQPEQDDDDCGDGNSRGYCDDADEGMILIVEMMG